MTTPNSVDGALMEWGDRLFYISENGRLEIEDDRQVTQALHDLVEQWRVGGSLIDEVG